MFIHLLHHIFLELHNLPYSLLNRNRVFCNNLKLYLGFIKSLETIPFMLISPTYIFFLFNPLPTFIPEFETTIFPILFLLDKAASIAIKKYSLYAKRCYKEPLRG